MVAIWKETDGPMKTVVEDQGRECLPEETDHNKQKANPARGFLANTQPHSQTRKAQGMIFKP
jgi:hypothetical protein